MSTCSSVDLPEPVLPAIRACCEVPGPSEEVLQLRRPRSVPSATSIAVSVQSPDQYAAPRPGAMIVSNGTSTRVGVLGRLAHLVQRTP